MLSARLLSGLIDGTPSLAIGASAGTPAPAARGGFDSCADDARRCVSRTTTIHRVLTWIVIAPVGFGALGLTL